MVQDIREAYDNLKMELIDKLKDQTMSVTLDIWSDHTMRGFIGITAHYVGEGILRSGLLTCAHFKGTYMVFSCDESIPE